MGRSLRPDVPGGRFHVMNRGVARQTTFFDDRDRVEFGRLLGVGHDRFGVMATAYCLMNNHYHLVLHCPDGGLSDFMHHIGSVFTRHANDRSGRDGPLFRGRFRSIPITDDNQLLNTVRYVHRNALDLPGVRTIDDYRWSSHRAYLGHRRTPSWLETDPVLAIFGQDRSAFHSFVASDNATLRPVGADTLPAIVDLVADECRDDVGPGVRRTLLLLVLDRLADVDDQQRLALTLKFSSQSALERALRRARRRGADEAWLSRLVDRVLSLAGDVKVVPGTTLTQLRLA
ncbi:MAG: hypothetical protein HKN44_14320 [Ilumatobacter sp.]|nr:hypothetical protein [Ilumatobacter sp.]